MYVHICESPGLNFLSDSSHYQEALKVSADFFHSVPAVSVPVAFEHCLRDLFSPSHILLASPLIRATVAGNSSVTPFWLTASCLKCLHHFNWGFSNKSSYLWGEKLAAAFWANVL